MRELGGRFLELDERTGTYKDIGDKKATEKTSQALREGQTKIRKQMYKDEKMSGNPTYDTSLLNLAPSGVPIREISAEGYFGYSVQVLESLYAQDETASNGGVPPGVSGQAPPLPQQTIASVMPSASPAAFASASVNSAAIAMALDEFPGAVPHPAPQHAAMQHMPPPPALNQPQAPDLARASIGRFTNSSIGITESDRPSNFRLTNMSMASMFSLSSVRQLLESARAENIPQPAGRDRGSIQSILSSEIRDLIRMSEPQLVAVENMTMDDGMAAHEDKELVLFDEDTMKDRVSELRFTDLSRDCPRQFGEPNPRLTDSSESTNYSKTSLMDASMMTIPTDEMSILGDHKASPRKSAAASGNDDGDLASAELLLRLSTDHHGHKNVSQV